ncbi:MAG: AAA family ATPase [Candidatus Methylacidiphilales bacterium]
MNLNSLTIKNIRSIQEHTFRLKPLTLVVGANSSGKSTFIRSFPLLRQSVETITRGPVLWFGPYVDFGVFNDVVCRRSKVKEIEFSFDINLPTSRDFSDSFPLYFRRLNVLSNINATVSVVISTPENDINTYTKRIELKIFNRTLTLHAKEDGEVTDVLIDGHKIKSRRTTLSIKSGASLFAISQSTKDISIKESNTPLPHSLFVGAFSDLIIDHMSVLFYHSTAIETKAELYARLGLGDHESMKVHLQAISQFSSNSVKRRVKDYSENTTWLNRLQALICADKLPQILNEVDAFVSNVFLNVSYIKPLRATAERFYRQQDLSVKEVDPQGANLAMFLTGLKDTEKKQFSLWCNQNIGFSVKAVAVGSHVSIKLIDSNEGEEFNIADMGFGYSQLLPVLAAMWRSLSSGAIKHKDGLRSLRSNDILPKFIVVEQPELHLHPRLQGKFANLLATLLNDEEDLNAKSSNTHIICETHSETIINEIGLLISRGQIKSQDVQVLLFDKKDDLMTDIRTSQYDKEGVLQNWPYGFFLPLNDDQE